jgi:8-oxo-dGTP diphosphatase
MTTVDDLWYLADEAVQQAEQTYHRLSDRAVDYLEFETTKHVSRSRFRTVAARIRDNGAPYGAHTLAYRPSGALVLVRHEAVGKWVLPGGECQSGETFRTAAERELHEEAGITAAYDGLGLLGRVEFYADGHSVWGVLPVFEAAVGTDAPPPTVRDPDGEITAAEWFEDLPEDTRDRDQVRAWRDRRF